MELEFPEDMREARVRAGQNMSDVERWLSMAAGIGFAGYGLAKQKGVAAWTLVGFAALLVRRGATGHCDTYELFGINTAGTGQDTRRALGGSAACIVDESVTINQPIAHAVSVLAESREPAAIHAASRIGRTSHRHAVALARQGAGRHDGRVERRDHQRGSRTKSSAGGRSKDRMWSARAR